MPTGIIIGDAHFKSLEKRDIVLEHEFVRRMVKIVHKTTPDFIVMLGDTLHEHGKGWAPALNLAEDLIESMSKVAHVFLLIGNHDLTDPNVFLSDQHFFRALHKWPNVTVVDKPVTATIDECDFVFCPFVQPGLFIKALNTVVSKGGNWDMADCIFAHQEFRGCNYGGVISTKGDEWSEDYPPVISGHIHDAQTIPPNIYYPGTPYQQSFGEKYNKCVWHVSFNDDGLTIEKVKLGLRRKRIISIKISDIDKFDTTIMAKYDVKVKVVGKPEEFTAFRKSEKYTSLTSSGAIITFKDSEEDAPVFTGNNQPEKISFTDILSQVVQTKSSDVKVVYDELFGGENDEPSEYESENSDYSFNRSDAPSKQSNSSETESLVSYDSGYTKDYQSESES